MHTYQSLNKNEVRAVEITIRKDRDGEPFSPEEVTTQVVDYDNNIIIPEQSALFNENVAYTMIGTAVTSNIGEYKLKWKLIKSSQTFYHITKLTIVDL